MKEIKLAITVDELQLLIDALEIVNPDSQDSCVMRDNLLTNFQNILSEERCSCETPHGPHTWGGRPMIYCPGVPRDVEAERRANRTETEIAAEHAAQDAMTKLIIG